MRELTYAVMLLFVVVATLPLELLLGTAVYTRLRRLGLTLLCVVPLFVLWDVVAVRVGHWSFDLSQTLGIVLPGDLPLEEALFFLVVPIASVITLEAVRAARGWPVGDEPPDPAEQPRRADPVDGADSAHTPEAEDPVTDVKGGGK